MSALGFLKSRTVWGALLLAAARIVGATPADRPAAIVEGLGIVVTAVGVRGAIAGSSSSSSAQ